MIDQESGINGTSDMTGCYLRSYTDYRFRRESHWNRVAEKFSHSGIKACYHRCLEALYRGIVPRGLNVLEIGCAKGELLASLAPTRGVGVDFSERMLKYARMNHQTLEFVRQDAHELSELNGPFDYIIFSDLCYFMPKNSEKNF